MSTRKRTTLSNKNNKGKVEIQKIPKNGNHALLYTTVHPFYQFNFGDYINVYFNPKQFVTLPDNYTKFQNTIKKFPTRDTDVFVVGHPRCGLNWVAEMVWCIENSPEDAKKSYLYDRCPCLEDTIRTRPIARLFNKYVRRNSFDYSHQLPGPRCIRSHLPISLLPETLQNGTGKIIYITRNPKDVCVSWFFMSTIALGFRGTLDEFITLFTNSYLCGPFWNCVLDAWVRRSNPNILFITYEELSRDLRSAILRIAEFIGKDLTNAQICKLLKHLSFEEMKKNNLANTTTLVDQIPQFLRSSIHGNPLRFGKVGTYLEQLDDAQIFLLEKWTRNAIVDTDFDLRVFQS